MSSKTLTRREILKGTGLAAAVIPMSSRKKQVSLPRKKPNIIVIHCHDLGRHLGCYGRGVQTPNLDKLASQGVRFDNYFSTAPFCVPSRCSRLTGLYPVNHGCMGTPLSWEMRRGTKTLPMYMNDAGYETHLFGLQHETLDVKSLGYKHFKHGSRSPGAATLALDVTPRVLEFLGRRQASDPPFYMDIGFTEAHMFQPRGGIQAWQGNEAPPRFKPKYVARQELKNYRGQLAVALENPCDPYKREYTPEDVPPLPYLPDRHGIREDMADLYSVITNVIDTSVGRILDKLRKKGLEKDTLVIFTTDHGIDMPRAKGTLHDPGIEVALIMRYPAGFKSGIAHGSMLSHVDFLPTILEFAGLRAPDNLDGNSFLPLILDQSYKERDTLYLENTWHVFYDPMRGIRTRRFKYIRNFDTKKHYWAVESKAAREVLGQTCYGTKPLEQFYDLEKDPHEQKNLASWSALYTLKRERIQGKKPQGDPAYKDQIKTFRDRLRAHMIETNDPLLKGPVVHPFYDLMWDT